jgi:hypothetical protein
MSWPKKGTTPARGEEAEVVVYQPRGVGLIHTRHKPSNAHYTHDDRPQRKSLRGSHSATKSHGDLETYREVELSPPATSPRTPTRPTRPAHMLVP